MSAHVVERVPREVCEAGIPTGDGAAAVEGGDAIGRVVDDVGEPGLLTLDGVEQPAAKEGARHLGRE